jgi:hypothetical protein
MDSQYGPTNDNCLLPNLAPDKAAQITNLQHTQKRPLLSDKRKNSSVVFSSENGSVSIEDLDRAYEQAKKSWGTSSAAAGNNKLGKPMGGQFSSYNLLWKENSLHRIKSSSIEDYSDRRQNRGNRIRRFRNAYNQQIERLKRKRQASEFYIIYTHVINKFGERC